MRTIEIEINDAAQKRREKLRKQKGLTRAALDRTVYELGLRQLETEAKNGTR